MKKPKEWLIRPNASYCGEFIQTYPCPDWRKEKDIDEVHVIEKKAFDEQKKEIERLEKEIVYLYGRLF